jgi:hypothetical protein
MIPRVSHADADFKKPLHPLFVRRRKRRRPTSGAGEHGSSGCPGKGSNAMAGSPDAVAFRFAVACGSLLPSCSWLSKFAEIHERQNRCSISIPLNWIGVAAS